MPHWGLKMMTSYAVPLQNTLYVWLAPSALPMITPKFSLNRRIFALILHKVDDFSVSARATMHLISF